LSLFVWQKKPVKMGVLVANDMELIRDRFLEMPGIPQQVSKVSLCTKSIDTPEGQQKLKPNPACGDMKMPGSNGVEILPATRKSNRNVIFFHLGFFTIRVLPRKDYTSLLRLFF
jgi:hypothetical protein